MNNFDRPEHDIPFAISQGEVVRLRLDPNYVNNFFDNITAGLLPTFFKLEKNIDISVESLENIRSISHRTVAIKGIVNARHGDEQAVPSELILHKRPTISKLLKRSVTAKVGPDLALL